MNLGRMFTVPSTRPRQPLSEVNTAEPCFIIHEKMDGSKEAIFHVNFIDLLDRVFLNNNQNFLSVEQERFIDVFYKKADEITAKINNNENSPYMNIDPVLLQLDKFLGGYVGESNGEYTR